MTRDDDELARLAGLVNIEIGRKHRRPTCVSCNRPASACWCCAVDSSALQDVRCKVLVLQHPHEEKRCLRTAPMLQHALPHCTVLKGKKFSRDEVPELTCADSIVLFPGPDAVEVTTLPTVAQRRRPYNIIVIDGTWHQARAIMYKTKELRALKKVVVRSDVVSHYVIRTQPSDAAVSTVECAALALAALEGRPHIYTALVRPLTALCQHQLSHGAVVHESKERRYRLAPAPSLGKRTAKTLAQCGAHVAALGAGLDDGANGADDGAKWAADGAKRADDGAKRADALPWADLDDGSKGVDDRCISADDRAKSGNDGAEGADDGFRDIDDGSKGVDDGHTFISDSGGAPEEDVGNDTTQSDAVCCEPASYQIPQTCVLRTNELENNRFKGSGDSACNVNPIMSAEKPEDVQNFLHVDVSLTMIKNQTELFRGTSDEPSDLLDGISSQDGACRR